MEIKNDILSKILKDKKGRLYLTKSEKAFIDSYGTKSYSDVNWLDLCDDIHLYKCYKLGYLFIRELILQQKYEGAYAKYIASLIEYLEKDNWTVSSNVKEFFCGEKIIYLVIFRQQQSLKFSYVYCDNLFLFSIIKQFLRSGHSSLHHVTLKAIMEYLGKSFGKYNVSIKCIEDFNAETFFFQVKKFKEYFSEDKQLRLLSIYLVCSFYRWLVGSYPRHNFFEKSTCMTEALLFNRNLKVYLEEDYSFVTLNPNNIPYNKQRIFFILKGLDNYSTRLKMEDGFAYDSSCLKSDVYRNLILEYIVTNSSITSIISIGLTTAITNGMQAVYIIKQKVNYPNPDLSYLSNQEAVFLRKYFDDERLSVATRNNKIGAIRRFISFCIDRKALSVDDMFFDYLIQYEEPVQNIAKAVPDEVLVALNQALIAKRTNDIIYKLMYVIFHLAIQTEFRISQICHLKLDCLKPTIKPNQYCITTNSKTSHGRKDSYVVSTLTYNLLMDIIEETKGLRRRCCVNSFKDYIFVYEKGEKKYTLFTANIFSDTLKKLCKEANVPQYTARNLRYTHMTKALEHIMRNGKSDIEMSILSKHTHLDTTKNHYIELELEKMLESTYGLTIGSKLIDTDSKIKESIPLELKGSENDVENGCGKCSAETCMTTNALPCLACKYFITTVKHEKFFKKAINNIDRLILVTKNRHDIEDLVTMKELYVLYLKSILKHKEGISYDN